MDNWLFDFRVSEVGGGLKRLEETARWCSERRPSTFIVGSTISQKLANIAPNNNYISFKMCGLERLICDSTFLTKQVRLSEYNCYFAYGVPLYKRLFDFQWLHISNALVLRPFSYTLPLSSRIKFMELHRRTIQGMNLADAISGESEFSIGEIRRYPRPTSCKVLVLPNGIDDLLLSCIQNLCLKEEAMEKQFALTVGTMPYKRIDRTIVAWKLYCERERIDIPLRIVGRSSPEILRLSRRIKGLELFDSLPRSQIYEMMRESRIFFSSSEVENSPNAALEALFLTRETCLSDIPSHRELVGNNTQSFSVNGFPYIFVKRKNYEENELLFRSWATIVSEMFEIPLK